VQRSSSPDNVLFEGGAGETIRRALLQSCNVHTLLRLPTGIWYSPGVKANVIFFDKMRETVTPATAHVWVYDMRSGQTFSLRQNPITSDDLADFVRCYCPDERSRRKETARFRRFSYAEILDRDRANLDLHWDSRDAKRDAPPESPQMLMKQILADLSEAMREFAAADEEIAEKKRSK
jgi:type I restriction enzyme M protein